MSDTFFKVKNFNIAGFPGKVKEKELFECNDTLSLGKQIEEGYLSTKQFFAVSVDGSILILKIKNGKLSIFQTLIAENKIVLLGGNEDFIIATYKEDRTKAVVFYKINSNFFKIQEIDLSNFQRFSGEIICSDVSGDILTIGDKKNIFIFEFKKVGIGEFKFFQQLFDNPNGDIGYSVQVEDNVLLTGGCIPTLSGNSYCFVSMYKFNNTSWSTGGLPDQTVYSPISPLSSFNNFGSKILINKSQVLISSPNDKKRQFFEDGQGEVYHYTINKGLLYPIMGIGSNYEINTPGFKFGESFDCVGNNLIISAPYSSSGEYTNVGESYIFKKNNKGYFDFVKKLEPENKFFNVYYGKSLGLIGSKTIISSSINEFGSKSSDINAYKVDCL